MSRDEGIEAADVYGWLNGSGAQPGCDGFDAHVVAAILALSAWEADRARSAVPDSVGLSGDELADLTAEMFPHAAAVFNRLRGRACSAACEDEACLRDLLRRSTTEGSKLEFRLADMIARRCLRPNHLWQDLGLRDRQELTSLMQRHFAGLAEKNGAAMRWKKFFYRTICRDDTHVVCPAPVCAECDDFDLCFGDERGESLLTRSRDADGAQDSAQEPLIRSVSRGQRLL